MKSLDEMTATLLGDAPPDEACFWSLASNAYRDGLARMVEARPGSSNLDLSSFCGKLLARDPDDIQALWTILGFDAQCCSNELSEAAWTRLHALGRFQPGWLVEYAYWVQGVSGVPTAQPLRELLRRHDLLDAARPALDALRDWAGY